MAATDFDVITFGNSLLLNDVFNAVASVFGNDSYSVALGTCMTAASIGIMISAVLQGKMVNLLWFLQVIFLYMMLIVPKVSVNIIDKTDIDPAHVVGGWTVRRVDNVPIGLAVTASSVSTFSSWLTTSFETVFSLPNEMRFQTNGPLFGQSLIKKAMTYKVQNPDLQESLKSFWQSCVFYDVALGFYTFGDLAKQTDILAFVGSHTVQTRGFYLGGSGAPTFETCADGVTPLRTQIDNDLNDAQQSIGNSVRTTMPSSSQVAAAGWTAMPVAFQYLTSVSLTAKNLLMQSVMANSMDDGLNALAGNADANAAIQGYALARAERERETSFGTMGKMAGDMMPLLRNMMEGLIYAVFPLVGLAVMFPNGWKAMGYYAKMLVWIGLWPVAFALLHYMMTFFGSLAGAKAAASAAGGAAAYTLETQLGLQEVFNKYEAIAGYLMTMLPMVTYVMVSQGGAMMSGMVGRVLDGYSTPASSAGMEASAGNFNMGNVSYENQAAFQHNSAPTQSAGFGKTNDGLVATTYAEGGAIRNYAQGDLPISGQVMQATGKQISTDLSNSREVAERTNIAAGEATQQALRTASGSNTQMGHGDSAGTNSNHSQSASAKEAYTTATKLAADWIDRTASGQTKDLAAQAAITAAVRLESKEQLAGRIAAMATGVSASISTSGTASVTKTNSESAVKEFANKFTQDATVQKGVEQATTDQITKLSGHTDTFSQTQSKSLERSLASMRDLSEQRSVAESNVERLTQSEKDIASSTTNLSTPLVGEISAAAQKEMGVNGVRQAVAAINSGDTENIYAKELINIGARVAERHSSSSIDKDQANKELDDHYNTASGEVRNEGQVKDLTSNAPQNTVASKVIQGNAEANAALSDVDGTIAAGSRDQSKQGETERNVVSDALPNHETNAGTGRGFRPVSNDKSENEAEFTDPHSVNRRKDDR